MSDNRQNLFTTKSKTHLTVEDALGRHRSSSSIRRQQTLPTSNFAFALTDADRYYIREPISRSEVIQRRRTPPTIVIDEVDTEGKPIMSVSRTVTPDGIRICISPNPQIYPPKSKQPAQSRRKRSASTGGHFLEVPYPVTPARFLKVNRSNSVDDHDPFKDGECVMEYSKKLQKSIIAISEKRKLTDYLPIHHTVSPTEAKTPMGEVFVKLRTPLNLATLDLDNLRMKAHGRMPSDDDKDVPILQTGKRKFFNLLDTLPWSKYKQCKMIPVRWHQEGIVLFDKITDPRRQHRLLDENFMISPVQNIDDLDLDRSIYERYTNTPDREGKKQAHVIYHKWYNILKNHNQIEEMWHCIRFRLQEILLRESISIPHLEDSPQFKLYQVYVRFPKELKPWEYWYCPVCHLSEILVDKSRLQSSVQIEDFYPPVQIGGIGRPRHHAMIFAYYGENKELFKSVRVLCAGFRRYKCIELRPYEIHLDLAKLEARLPNIEWDQTEILVVNQVYNVGKLKTEVGIGESFNQQKFMNTTIAFTLARYRLDPTGQIVKFMEILHQNNVYGEFLLVTQSADQFAPPKTPSTDNISEVILRLDGENNRHSFHDIRGKRSNRLQRKLIFSATELHTVPQPELSSQFSLRLTDSISHVSEMFDDNAVLSQAGAIMTTEKKRSLISFKTAGQIIRGLVHKPKPSKFLRKLSSKTKSLSSEFTSRIQSRRSRKSTVTPASPCREEDPKSLEEVSDSVFVASESQELNDQDQELRINRVLDFET